MRGLSSRASRQPERESLVEILKEAAHRLVAFASRRLKPFVVEDLNLPAVVRDELASSQGAGGESDGGAARTEDVGKESLTEQNAVGAGEVVRCEQPAREALFGIMQAAAGSELGEDHAAALRAFHDELAQGFGALDFFLQLGKRDAEGFHFHLNDTTGGAGRQSAEEVMAGNDAFATGHGDLSAAAVGHGDHFGRDAGGNEEGVARDSFGFVKHRSRG